MSSSDFLQLLFDATIKSTLVLLLVVGLHWLIPKAAAATKHLFLALALAACLCLPLLTLALPTWRIPLLPAPSSGIVKTPRAVPSLVTKASYAPPMEDFAFEQPVLVTSVSEPPRRSTPGRRWRPANSTTALAPRRTPSRAGPVPPRRHACFRSATDWPAWPVPYLPGDL